MQEGPPGGEECQAAEADPPGSLGSDSAPCLDTPHGMGYLSSIVVAMLLQLLPSSAVAPDAMHVIVSRVSAARSASAFFLQSMQQAFIVRS